MKKFKRWFIIIVFLLAGCASADVGNKPQLHQTIAFADVEAITEWGPSHPEGETEVTSKENMEKIVTWFNEATDIRLNQNFPDETAVAGLTIELKSGEKMMILRTGKDFEVQRRGVTYWAKQPELKTVLSKLASKPPASKPQQPINPEIIDQIADWEGYRSIEYTNGWVKQLYGEIEGELLTVAAGAYRKDPSQGVLHVTIRGKGKKDSPFLSIKDYPSPAKSGALKIKSFDGFQLTVTAADGRICTFDALTGQFSQ